LQTGSMIESSKFVSGNLAGLVGAE
jgi:hypothetical protein